MDLRRHRRALLSLVVLTGLAWWFTEDDGDREKTSRDGDMPAAQRLDGTRPALATGLGERPVDPANVIQLPEAGGELIASARQHPLHGDDIRFERDADARAFAELTSAPEGAIDAVARCQLDFLKLSDEPCSAEFVGFFRSDPDSGTSRLLALQDATTLPDGPEDMGPFDPRTEHGQEACRRYRRCVARAVLGQPFTTPSSLSSAEAWSSTVSPDMHLLGEDFMKYTVGDDLRDALDEYLAVYEDANPWLAKGDDFESLFEAGNRACAEEAVDYGPDGPPLDSLVATCRSTVGTFAMAYLLRRAMRRMLNE